MHPILEYCSPVWSPHFKKDSVILEKVQSRTSRYAVRNIGRDMSYEECLRALSWPTLHQRLFSSLTECSRTVNSVNGLRSFEYFTFAHDFRPLQANYRHKLKPFPAKLNSFKNSLFVNTQDLLQYRALNACTCKSQALHARITLLRIK